MILYSILWYLISIYYMPVPLIVTYFLLSESPLSQLLHLFDPFCNPHVLTYACHLWIQNFFSLSLRINITRLSPPWWGWSEWPSDNVFFLKICSLFFFFPFGEDCCVTASEKKTECCNIGNYQNINLLPITRSSSSFFLGFLLPFLLSSRHQTQHSLYFSFHKHLHSFSEMRLHIKNIISQNLGFFLILPHLKKNT